MNFSARISPRYLMLTGGIGCLLAVSWLGLQACSIAASDLIATVDRLPVLVSLRDTVIIPRAENFSTQAAVLEVMAGKLAAQPGAALLDSVQAQWKKTALAWAELQVTRLGPIAMRMPAVNFWPTRPNLIEQGLSGSDPLDSNRLATLTPSAAKGLPAMEWLLFSPSTGVALAALQDSLNGKRRGQYIAAVASDIRRNASGILSDWRGETGEAFVYPGPGRLYPTSQMAIEELILGLVAGLEEMKNAKVLTPAGVKSDGRPQPDAVESPYAGISLDLLGADIDGVEAVFKGFGPTGSGTGLNAYMNQLGSEIPARIDQDIATARQALASVSPPLASAVTAQKAEVAALGAAITNLVVTVKNDVASTLGFNITFTDNDGD